MPRSSNNKSSQTKQNIPAPSPLHVPSPAPLHVPSMVDSMKQGFGFGIGSAIPRNLFTPFNISNADYL